MTTTYWHPSATPVAQVDTLTVAGTPAAGNKITATIGDGTATYTLVTGDTVSTAAAGLSAVLNGSTASPEFQSITWTVSGAVITGTASSPGTPFTLSASATGGGATLTRASVQANVGPSDVGNSANWIRSGVASLPQNGDDVVVAGTAIGLLYNLAALAAVQFLSYTRWQSFTGQIGLPTQNPAGYREYRPTYFEFTSAGTVTLLLGEGAGAGPSRERYDVGATQANLQALASGGAADDVSVRFLTTNAASTVLSSGVSVGIATDPGEVAALASARATAGGSLAIGPGCTVSGQVQADGATAQLSGPAGSILAQNGSAFAVTSEARTYSSVIAKNGSRLTWLSDSTITSLDLQTGSVLDKSSDPRPITITSSSLDGDGTAILDPTSAITYTNATAVRGIVSSGVITFGAGKNLKVS